MRTAARLLVSAALILVIALGTACGGSSDESSADRAASDAGTTGGALSQGAAPPQDAGGGAGSVGAASPPAPGNTGPAASGGDGSAGNEGTRISLLQQLGSARSVVYTSQMVVIVEDVSAATERARTAIAGLGGLVFGQNTVTEPIQRTVLTFKVPPQEFDEAQRRLGAIGKLESQQVSADDVTERVIDLESRIITTEASVQRLRAFLQTAVSLEAVAQLERELLQRETDLELLRGQLRTLQDQAALATITVTLTEKEPLEPEAAVELVQTGYVGHDAGDRCPDDDELQIDERAAMTICSSVENTGNRVLSNIEVRDTGLNLDADEFVPLVVNLDGELGPGERLVGYFETRAEVGRLPSPSFSATVLDEDGDEIRIGINVEREVLDLQVVEDTSVPSFAEGLSASFSALVTGARVTILMLGVAVPFLWLPPLAAVVVWWVRRRASPVRPVTTPVPAEPGPGEEDQR